MFEPVRNMAKNETAKGTLSELVIFLFVIVCMALVWADLIPNIYKAKTTLRERERLTKEIKPIPQEPKEEPMQQSPSEMSLDAIRDLL